jgi:hypothetical protein
MQEKTIKISDKAKAIYYRLGATVKHEDKVLQTLHQMFF